MGRDTQTGQTCGGNGSRHAIAFMLISTVSLSVHAVVIKSLSASYDVSEITTVRYALQLAIALLVNPRSIAQLVLIRQPLLHALAATLILCQTVLFSIAIIYIPMSSATAALSTAPLIVVMLAKWTLGETVGLYRWIAVGLGMFGALLIAKPGLESEHWAIFVAFGGAMAVALFHLSTRSLARCEDPASSIAYMSLVCFSICSLSWSDSWRLPVSMTDLAAFLALGVTGWIGHSFVLKAMELAQASTLVPLNYTQLIAVSVLGYLFFAQIPDLWTLTGAAIIAGSGILCASARHA